MQSLRCPPCDHAIREAQRDYSLVSEVTYNWSIVIHLADLDASIEKDVEMNTENQTGANANANAPGQDPMAPGSMVAEMSLSTV
jgi:hypothetical protein